MPRKLLVGGLQRHGSVKGVVKKVAPPTVPPARAPYPRSPCICNSDEHLARLDFDKPRSPPAGNSSHYAPSFYSSISPQQLHPMKKMTPGAGSNGQIHLAHVIVHSQPDSLPSTPSDTGHSPSLSKGRLMSGTQASLEDQGIEVGGGGRHSPGGSSGGSSSISRHSLSSLDSGRASAPGSEGKAVNRRLSIQSYEGGSPQRRSYHSSSSSIASAGDDLGPAPNVPEMILHGLPDVEILTSWLGTLHFEEYIPLFLLAGYDMPTISRMTPEDLTAIGITKPNHRRKLKAEIAKLNITDGIPDYKPDSLLEWLQLLRLEDYFDTLCQQNYNTVDKVTELTWEDLEDIGIQKLGHQKRILLAIKRIDDINHGRRPNLYPQTILPNRGTCGNNVVFCRPSTLSNVQPVHYTSQEIAISTHCPKTSPSADSSAPEMKTFQQSPLREESLFMQAVHNSAQGIASTHNGGIHSIISPTRVRSLESLHSSTLVAMVNSEPPAPKTYTPLPAAAQQPEPSQPPPKEWRVTDLDQDGDFECEGTATLNRPKGLIRLKPMAKIAAKTREEIAEAIMDIPDSEFKSLINPARQLDGWSSLDGSPRHGPSTVPRSAAARRPPPPPPPKRGNSAKTEGSPVREEANPPTTPPKPEPPRPRPELMAAFAKPAARSEQSSRPPAIKAVPLKIPRSLPPPPTTAESPKPEEFPPPPSPLASALEANGEEEEDGAGVSKEELFNNPLFRQRRKDSSGSQTAVGEPGSMPFANEAVSTLKQRAARMAAGANPPPLTSQQRAAQKARNERKSNALHEYDVTPEAVSPGDVIDDIEHMLANLSDELDLMLDEESKK